VRDLVAKAIIGHDLSFSFTEYRRTRELLNYFNPKGEVYSRCVATNDVIDMYHDEKT
jgi:hypothetical protein